MQADEGDVGAAGQKPIRCAIYVRKSSEEGLEQAYNSLHAQTDACRSYIRAQKHEGWTVEGDAYEDGGFSGGSMERPGLQRLLTAIRAKSIDTIVVYKIDRLTRSLADFSKMMELFDAEGVSFVSVTQQFNTTTSMGRLTLNVLLSFAQFEREITGERIRDKIAASKAKGIWMGGIPPLGYRAEGRNLVIDQTEALQLRSLFDRYLALGSVHRLKDELDAQGARSKAWTTRSGKVIGGKPFSRGALFHLLRNRIYLGEIVHKDKVHQGLHPAIIERALFDAVAKSLDQNGVNRRGRKARAAASPLTGRLRDLDGHPMTSTFAYGKSGRLYRYYVSQSLQQGPTKTSFPGDRLKRVSAPALERLVLQRLTAIGDWQDWPAAGPHLKSVVLGAEDIILSLHPASVELGARPAALITRIKERLPPGDCVSAPTCGVGLQVLIPIRARFRGGRTWLLGSEEMGHKPHPDPKLVKGLQTAHALCNASRLNPNQRPAVVSLAKTPRQLYARSLCALVFLAPDLQKAILEGRQPRGLTLQTLLRSDIPLGWPEQRIWFRNL